MTDDFKEDKKAKGTKKCVRKLVCYKLIKFSDYKYCLLNSEVISKSQQRFKSERNDVCTKEINKIAPSSNDDKRLQTIDNYENSKQKRTLANCFKSFI